MKIKFYGQSCFLMTPENGPRTLTDPFSGIGLPVPRVSADIVTVSHSHFDHNNTGAVEGDFKIIDRPGKYDCGGAVITGTPSFHDASHGRLRGKNIIFTFETEGLKICHLGDLGHLPGRETLGTFGNADILFVPAGEVYTMDAGTAAETARLINAKVVIPMHYKVPGLNIPLSPVDKFEKSYGGSKRLGCGEINITRENLDRYSGLVILEPGQ